MVPWRSGGMALALRLGERWPSILLNETHPKVLIPALGGERYADAAQKSVMLCATCSPNVMSPCGYITLWYCIDRLNQPIGMEI
jgi:hypothetical protein